MDECVDGQGVDDLSREGVGGQDEACVRCVNGWMAVMGKEMGDGNVDALS